VTETNSKSESAKIACRGGGHIGKSDLQKSKLHPPDCEGEEMGRGPEGETLSGARGGGGD